MRLFVPLLSCLVMHLGGLLATSAHSSCCPAGSWVAKVWRVATISPLMRHTTGSNAGFPAIAATSVIVVVSMLLLLLLCVHAV
ncbi:hypothetical protein [Thiolinea disciformis]|uniref:hypothetical protein n=1 Tax=Thiolinea disciformis TaxID=125614 RepID=UPI0012FEFEBA|nr:hypothetical protein [Thiolinea disciformis]